MATSEVFIEGSETSLFNQICFPSEANSPAGRLFIPHADSSEVTGIETEEKLTSKQKIRALEKDLVAARLEIAKLRKLLRKARQSQ